MICSLHNELWVAQNLLRKLTAVAFNVVFMTLRIICETEIREINTSLAIQCMQACTWGRYKTINTDFKRNNTPFVLNITQRSSERRISLFDCVSKVEKHHRPRSCDGATAISPYYRGNRGRNSHDFPKNPEQALSCFTVVSKAISRDGVIPIQQDVHLFRGSSFQVLSSLLAISLHFLLFKICFYHHMKTSK